MHDSTKRQPGSGRPSLLTPAQPPAGDSHGILSQLDGDRPAARKAPGRRSPALAVGALSAAVLGAGAVVWFVVGGAAAPGSRELAVAAAPLQVSAPAPAHAPVPMALETQFAAAAAPHPAVVRDEPPHGGVSEVMAPGSAEKTLAQALDAAPSVASDKSELAQLLEAPPRPDTKAKPVAKKKARKVVAKKRSQQTKLARADKPRAKSAKSKPARKKPQAAVDRDAALLAALLTYSKESKNAERPKASSRFKRCAASASALEAEQCRARLCEGEAKGAVECKSFRISKASG